MGVVVALEVHCVSCLYVSYIDHVQIRVVIVEQISPSIHQVRRSDGLSSMLASRMV